MEVRVEVRVVVVQGAAAQEEAWVVVAWAAGAVVAGCKE